MNAKTTQILSKIENKTNTEIQIKNDEIFWNGEVSIVLKGHEQPLCLGLCYILSYSDWQDALQLEDVIPVSQDTEEHITKGLYPLDMVERIVLNI